MPHPTEREASAPDTAVSENPGAETRSDDGPGPGTAPSSSSRDDLSHLSAAEIDSLPFGYIALAPDGTVRKYNRYEADLARKDPQEVLDRNFFREVAPCTQVQEFEGRFREFLDSDRMATSFDFEFKFRHGAQRVRIGFVRSPLGKEVIVTVNRLADLELPDSSEVQVKAGRGVIEDASGTPVVVTGADFWRSLPVALAQGDGKSPGSRLHLLGRTWARQHLTRVEAIVQESQDKTLREVEVRMAFESLSASLGLYGLGRFEVDLDFQRHGLLRVLHQDSPFVTMLQRREEASCGLLAGFHAGVVSHLAGRDLTCMELTCSRSDDAPCVFLVGTEDRLTRLMEAPEGSDDRALLDRLSTVGDGGSP